MFSECVEDGELIRQEGPISPPCCFHSVIGNRPSLWLGLGQPRFSNEKDNIGLAFACLCPCLWELHGLVVVDTITSFIIHILLDGDREGREYS